MLLAPTETQLPRLAWIASYTAGDPALHLAHGPDVEVRDDWAAEGAWDGAFDREGLAESPNLYGSALIVDDSGVTFRTATSLVDRLWVATRDGEVKVSNSLPLVLAATGSELVPGHDYSVQMNVITAGIHGYDPAFPVTGEWAIEQRYYSTIRVSPDAHVEARLYEFPADFPRFEAYQDYVFGVVDALRGNLESSGRRAPVKVNVSLSNGYDSTLSAVLAKRAGGTSAFTRRRATTIIPARLSKSRATDDGSPAAAALGLDVADIPDAPTGEWDPDLELAFLAGSPRARETVFLPMATNIAAGPVTALFCGYNGDRIWERKMPEFYMEDVRRTDYSGITMGEARLVAGYFLVAVAFAGAEGIRSIHRIGNSDEMKPWSVAEDYDRPVPRRIIEEAGVARGSFGLRKKAVWSFIDSAEPTHPELTRDVATHPATESVEPVRAATLKWRARSLARFASARVGRPWPASILPHGHESRSSAIYSWAVQRLTERYSKLLGT